MSAPTIIFEGVKELNVSDDTLTKAREHALTAQLFYNDVSDEIYIFDFKIGATWFSSKLIEKDLSSMTLVAF